MGNRRVKNLTMQGFRSFPDRVAINLSGGLTCIADPEGTGAAEICSALCFLAGRPTPSGAGPADLLFEGNDTREPAVRLAVSALIEGDASEAEARVTRVYSLPDKEQYYLDGTKCTDEVAQKILSGTGIYGYSIMDRNTAFDVLTARPGTIRDALEGAAGTSYLRQQADDEEAKLKDAIKALKELRGQIDLCREKRAYLQEESIRVKDFHRISSMLRDNEISIMLRRIDQFERDREMLEIRIDEIAHRIEERDKKRSELDLLITEKQIQQRNLENREIEEQGVFLFRRNETDDEKLKVGVINGSVAAVDLRLETMNRELTALRSSIERERQNSHHLQKESLKIADRLTSAEKSLHRTDVRLEEKRKELSEQSAAYDQIVEELSACQSSAASLRAQLDGMKELQNSHDTYRQALSRMIADRRGELPDEASYDHDLRRKDALKEKKEKAETKLSMLEEDLRKAQKHTSDCFLKQNEAAQRLSAEQSRRDLLQDQARNFESESSGSVKFLKDAGITGIHAPAGELMRVHSGYESVIASALGRHAGDLVCDDLSAASKAAEYLKKHHAGRMAFIPLKELDYKYRVVPDELLKADGFVIRALDCIEYDQDYASVFLYLLGNTLIFRDLPSAVDAGRYRGIHIVTMDGETLYDSEVMEGGAYKSSGIRLFEHRNVLKAAGVRTAELEKAAKKADSDYEAALKAQNILEEQVSELHGEIEQYRSELHTLLLSLEMEARLFTDTRKDVMDLNEELEQYDSDEKVTSLSAKMEDLFAESQKMQDEAERLETRKNQLYLQRERLQVEIRELENQYQEWTIKLYSCQCDAAVNQIFVEKSEEILREYDERTQEIVNLVKTIREERTAYVRKKEQTERIIRGMENELSEKLRILSGYRKERVELRSTIQRLLSGKDQSENEYRVLCLEKRALEVERDDCVQSAEGMKKQFYDEFRIPYVEAVKKKSPVFTLNEGLKESARLRNLLRSYKVVNTAAPEELKKATEQYFAMEAKRRELEAEMEQYRENAGIYRAKASVVFRQLFDAVAPEFERCFRELEKDSDASARLRVTEKNERTGSSVDVMVRRPGYTAVGLMKASPQVKGAALAAFIVALHSAETPALFLLDSLDDVLSPEQYGYLMKNLIEKSGESVLAVTSTDQMAKSAADTYVYLRMDDGGRDLKRIAADEFGTYTPDPEL